MPPQLCGAETCAGCSAKDYSPEERATMAAAALGLLAGRTQDEFMGMDVTVVGGLLKQSTELQRLQDANPDSPLLMTTLVIAMDAADGKCEIYNESTKD